MAKSPNEITVNVKQDKLPEGHERRFRISDSQMTFERAFEEDGQRFIEGYAALFNHRSRIISDWDGTYFEEIRTGAFDAVLSADNIDVLHTYNHNPNQMLGRYTKKEGEVTQETLTLTIDEVGLKYRVSVPNTPTGNEVFELVQRGDLNESSFVFSIRSDGQQWTETEDSDSLRIINTFAGLYDTSTVRKGAYSNTDVDVAKRFYQEFKEGQKPPKDDNEPEPDRTEPKEEVRIQNDLDSMKVRILQLK
jgi:HK97 family phage prohead protease